jgi:transposase InsO family protein
MRARGFRVESICRVLTEQGVQVAPRTYRNWKTAAPSARTVTDAHLTDALRETIGTPEGLYGRRKMTAYLRRQGHRVAACTVDRLMRDEGLSGVIRGRRHRTTIPGGKDARRAPDLLDRDFSAEAPNRKWVTDFTYTRTWAGFVYVLVTWNHAVGRLFVSRRHHELRGHVHCVGDLGGEVAGPGSARAGGGVVADLG